MQTNFHFHSDAVDPDTLKVVEFEGEERISGPYAYRIDLIAEDDALDLEAILDARAYFGLERDGEQLKIHGILSDFEQLGRLPYHTHYRAVLVPRLWLMTLRRQNQIYQEMTVQDIIKQELMDAGLTSDDFEFRLTNGYEAREYVAQYRETDLDFISRLMEHEGIFYFFEQQDDREKLVIADGNVAFAPIPQASPIPFRDPAGMETTDEEAIQALICRQRRVTGNVILKDYNFRNPGMQMRAEHPEPIDESLDGLISEYGDHFRTDDDGRRLAKIRGEEQAVGRRQFLGESDCTALRGGHFFELTDHNRGEFDQRYLLTELRHVGRQTNPGVDGLAAGSVTGDPAPDAEGTAYRNEFTAIPADVPFRPACLTPRPKMHGIMNAHVDAASDGQYAELDDQGRYKLVLPFDLTGKGDGKASRYVRMAQPYAGRGFGVHRPLHKGTEVVWAAIDGDPDRPIITGAVPNPQTVSPVTSTNQTQSVLRDHGGNETVMEGKEGGQFIHTKQTCGNEFRMDGTDGAEKIELRDKYGNEFVMDAVAGTIRIYSPTHETEIVLGKSVEIKSLSDLKEYFQGQYEGEIVGPAKLKIGADVTEFFAGAHHKTTLGITSKLIGGWKQETIVGAETKSVNGLKREIVRGAVFKRHYGKEYKVPSAGKVDKTPSLFQAIRDYKTSRRLSKEIIESEQIIESKGRTVRHMNKEIVKIKNLNVETDSEKKKIKTKLLLAKSYKRKCDQEVTKAKTIKTEAQSQVLKGNIKLG